MLTTKKKKTEKSNGTTDLTRGNKFHPGDTAVTAHDSTGSDPSADDTEKVPSSREQTGETAGRASDLGSTAKSPDATKKSDSDGDASNDADRKAA